MSKVNIFVAGHKGMVGSSIVKLLIKKSKKNLITKSHSELDLTNQTDVIKFFKKYKINQIYLAAAKVGGIYANSKFPAEFIYKNLMIEANVIHSAFLSGIKKILFLGSSCIYPKITKTPIKEEDLLSGKLEPTNEPYAIAKIAGIKMCESYNNQYGRNYISLMPTNTFGPGDNYNLENSHFIPAILRKLHQAKINKKKYINLWGTGKSKREIIYVEDLANAIIYFINKKTNHSLINIGTSKEHSIKKIANKILKILDLDIKIKFDNNSKFDGTKRKVLDTTIAKKYGWKPKINFEKAIIETYKDLVKNYKKIKGI